MADTSAALSTDHWIELNWEYEGAKDLDEPPDDQIAEYFAAPLALTSTRRRVQISHFGAVQGRPGVSAFWRRSCLAVPGTRLAAGLGA